MRIWYQGPEFRARFQDRLPRCVPRLRSLFSQPPCTRDRFVAPGFFFSKGSVRSREDRRGCLLEAVVDRWESRRGRRRRGRLRSRPRLSSWLHPSTSPANAELRTEPFWIARGMTPTPRDVCVRARTSRVVLSRCKLRKPFAI